MDEDCPNLPSDHAAAASNTPNDDADSGDSDEIEESNEGDFIANDPYPPPSENQCVTDEDYVSKEPEIIAEARTLILKKYTFLSSIFGKITCFICHYIFVCSDDCSPF
jgi:hypothetical protein